MKAVVQRVTRASVTVGGCCPMSTTVGEMAPCLGKSSTWRSRQHRLSLQAQCLPGAVNRGATGAETPEQPPGTGLRPSGGTHESWPRSCLPVRKILNLRVFEDESGKPWSKSVMDKQYEVLCVSQFTLQCVLKGNKPDFHLAMPTEQAESFYNSFLEQLRKTYRPELIKDGKFGAYMQVHIQNDGPVTIELESPAPGTATSDPKQPAAVTELGPWPVGTEMFLDEWQEQPYSLSSI
ncbi:D-tyrosyl-tRNA(Tyr) deacylase 1 isoform X2 [Heterocephalus glaber]|uniref:D-aminoacyl-tRNA deacylase 1 n=1 Tax=Heterocephalus glaber TaxID=10181 RepID=A0AAX6SNI7_HETGA|nr:D-tyrosyl-tRNA(Tyr) deacylase 1 isoform X2 [Heterocephalus glaber]